MDPGLLPKLEVYARDSQPQITALMVVRHGYIVFEEYYGGFGEDSYFSLHSITKSVLSALIGSALRSGAIRDLDQGLLEYFPERAASEADPRKRAITLRHVLSMTSGFEEAASSVEILWRSDDVVGAALERPMAHDPGERFFYRGEHSSLVDRADASDRDKRSRICPDRFVPPAWHMGG